MAENNYMDDQLDIMCEGFFDNIDDLLDFSADEETLGMADSNNALMNIPPATEFPALDSKDIQVMPVSDENKIGNEFGMGEDWFSNFLHDVNLDEEIKKNEPLFLSFSPDSVLEPSNLSAEKTISPSSSFSSSSSSSSFSSYTTSLPPLNLSKAPIPARARSKRPRKPIIPVPPPAPLQLTAPEPVTIKKIKIKVRSTDSEDGTGARKCRHCGIQKTPQWRAGPMGPKTLCNACGVRYKSGRLFPEYRPAASPTFVPSVHSNSHKKVVEIRNKVIETKVVNEYNPAAKNCDLLKYIRV